MQAQGKEFDRKIKSYIKVSIDVFFPNWKNSLSVKYRIELPVEDFFNF